jgi:FKBP-type peptidyl-prolyl cis-trans isomerase SlyD
MGERGVVADDKVVEIDYTLSLDDGEVYDSSAETGPLEYLHGHDQLIPGLEAALAGMQVGETKDVVVTPDVGYGEYDPDAVELVPLDALPADMDLEPGMSVDLYDEESDQEIEAFVAEVNAEGVLLDMNHPLAGETLHFNVKVLSVRNASPEEIVHGHVHGEAYDDQ